MADPFEFVPPFISPLTHDEHARIGRIALLWGQVDMVLDGLLQASLGITIKQRRALIGEKPLGAKLDLLGSNLDGLGNKSARALATKFWELANETKSKRNRCFHGVWGFGCAGNRKVKAAASHFKAGNDPVTAGQLPALEKKLCKTARVGFNALVKLHQFPEHGGAVRLFHGVGDPPPWLSEWNEQHPLDNRSLDRRWKEGRLPFLTKPL